MNVISIWNNKKVEDYNMKILIWILFGINIMINWLMILSIIFNKINRILNKIFLKVTLIIRFKTVIIFLMIKKYKIKLINKMKYYNIKEQ